MIEEQSECWCCLLFWRHSKFHFTSIHPWYVAVVVLLFSWETARCVRIVFAFYSIRKRVERDKWCCEARCSLLECRVAVWVLVRCTIFTAIYGFEGFVNIILMFNETIINQVVCESKIATMTFFPEHSCCVFSIPFMVMNALAGIGMKIGAIALLRGLLFTPCCYCSLKKHKIREVEIVLFLPFHNFYVLSSWKEKKEKKEEEKGHESRSQKNQDQHK